MVGNTNSSRMVFFPNQQPKTKQNSNINRIWAEQENKKITQTNFRLNYSALTNQKKKTKNSTIKIARNNPKFLWISACMCVFMFTLRIFFFFFDFVSKWIFLFCFVSNMENQQKKKKAICFQNGRYLFDFISNYQHQQENKFFSTLFCIVHWSSFHTWEIWYKSREKKKFNFSLHLFLSLSLSMQNIDRKNFFLIVKSLTTKKIDNILMWKKSKVENLTFFSMMMIMVIINV